MGKRRVHVMAPGRLHLGFIDLHGGMGRTFGSLGLCLDDIHTHVSAVISDSVFIHGPSSHRASVYAGRMLEYLGIHTGVELTIHEAIPDHAGLGSGTQLSFAVGTAIARAYGYDVPVKEVAEIMERGARSGIGIGAFTLGGFLVDGGRGNDTDTPPIICHLPFPEAWRLVLVFDSERQGMHGMREKLAFENLPPMTERITEYLCRVTLMQVLPALAEADCERFGSAISEIQMLVGDHFAPLQGGRFCSQPVSQVLSWMPGLGATGIGQSSWGPTGFALFANETRAYQAMRLAREKWSPETGLSFRLGRARNQKAEIRLEDDESGKNFKLKKL
ncbi:MAG: beta-ribofuranosylaminobenzene 5'-phosphate synthase family protein [Gammaproteobacteria bacterium]